MFLINADIEMEYATVVGEIESRPEFYNNRQRDRFMIGADPWLIALARTMGECTVVSAEKKSLADYGLGAVCKAMNVQHMNLVELFEVNAIGR